MSPMLGPSALRTPILAALGLTLTLLTLLAPPAAADGLFDPTLHTWDAVAQDLNRLPGALNDGLTGPISAGGNIATWGAQQAGQGFGSVVAEVPLLLPIH